MGVSDFNREMEEQRALEKEMAHTRARSEAALRKKMLSAAIAKEVALSQGGALKFHRDKG